MFFQRFLLDSIYITHILTYCTSIIFSEKLDKTDEIKDFFESINKTISEALKHADNMILKPVLEDMDKNKKQLSDILSKLYEDNKAEIKNKNFWIEDIKDLSYLRNHGLIERSLIFADGTLDYHIIHCPKKMCAFFKLFDMHVMYSKIYLADFANYLDYIDSIDNFYYDLGEINSRVNKSNSNLTAIVEEFVQFNPFRHLLYRSTSAVIFYKQNETDFKLGFHTMLNFQPYARRTIQTKSGTIKFIARSGYFPYSEMYYTGVILV
jgi:hypothetical protein